MSSADSAQVWPSSNSMTAARAPPRRNPAWASCSPACAAHGLEGCGCDVAIGRQGYRQGRAATARAAAGARRSGTNRQAMRNRQLHAALAAFAEEAAWRLAADTAEGAEVAFEVAELGGSRREAPLYCYRPLTAAFIDERRGVLGQLPTYLPAVHALAACGGVAAYLVARGETRGPPDPRPRAEEALRLFLARVFEESSDFSLSAERLGRAYAELETAVMD